MREVDASGVSHLADMYIHTYVVGAPRVIRMLQACRLGTTKRRYQATRENPSRWGGKTARGRGKDDDDDDVEEEDHNDDDDDRYESSDRMALDSRLG